MSRATVDPVGGDPRLPALARGRCADPFALLGAHDDGQGGVVVRTLQPGAHAVAVVTLDGMRPMRERDDAPGVFEARLTRRTHYRLRVGWPDGSQDLDDPYAFGPALREDWLEGFARGDGECARLALGAQHAQLEGSHGVRFAVWAPNAVRVSVVGDFNGWDGRRHPMRLRHHAGVWELFVPGLAAGERYKYEVVADDGRVLPLKADPMARCAEMPPATASVVPPGDAFAWGDAEWMRSRARFADRGEAISIYEVHAGSWRHDARGGAPDWDMLARELVPYVVAMGFTHVELLPITEYPFGGSWGYQPLGMYAPTARLGPPAGFARFVDACHRAGIGVILDWVSAHFPGDAHGLERFDGTALYEHEDPREGFHRDWHTLIYNYGRPEVAAYLAGSALEWIERYHVDGLRVDAVASMLYRDYSRPDGEWIPNAQGGRENLEAVAFLRSLNAMLRQRCPDVLVVAEESTAWAGVTHAPEAGGLGFSHKWNMGWMHDTLRYVRRDPVHRRFHHSDLTFGAVYAFSERFVLPLSHDEVVHGKGSLLSRMPGDRWQRFANLRAYFGFMWAHPGRKLLFMGGEFGQWAEWDHDRALDWHLLEEPMHAGLQRAVADLNRLMRREPALHRGDHVPEGFAWIIGDDAANSVYAFLRSDPDGGAPVLAICNFTPTPHHGYRVGVPTGGAWRELFNSDSTHYGGGNLGNGGTVHADALPRHGQPCSLSLTLPPLATLLLRADTA